MGESHSKDPNAVLDYRVDWSSWLAGGETISTSAWTVPTGITEVNDAGHPTSSTTTTATIWLSGGTDGTRYRVTNRITTSQGRTEDRSIYVSVMER